MAKWRRHTTACSFAKSAVRVVSLIILTRLASCVQTNLSASYSPVECFIAIAINKKKENKAMYGMQKVLFALLEQRSPVDQPVHLHSPIRTFQVRRCILHDSNC